jgi:membrane-bound lytic murein transglycosylase D
MNYLSKHLKGVCFLIVCILHLQAFASADGVHTGNDPYSSNVIIERFSEMNLEVDVRLTKNVKSYIRDYTLLARKSSELALGKSTLYFPIFEELNNAFGLPDELKYLMVIESSLKPDAASKVGAKGLWQLMPATARGHGLEINDYVDERSDPYRSTNAALNHLTELFDEFGDWTLVIAAYNCGNGRMRSAIKKGKSKNFWKIKKHLPKQTQDYIEKFIAAAYTMEYYHFYDLRPDYPDYNEQYTQAMLTYDYGRLSEISEKENVDLDLLQMLNPSYKLDIIPIKRDGNIIIVPNLTSQTKRSATASLLQEVSNDNL